jgi:drug/metabolite transporter (DMT)-like permease
MPASRTPLYGLALVLALSLLWGVNWPVMKIGLAEIPPLTFRAAMMMLGGPGLLLCVRLAGTRIRVAPGKWWPLAYVSGFMIVAWMILSAFGLRLMQSGSASILAFTMPAWSAFLGAWILGERFTARRALALAAGLAGVVVLLLRDPGAFGGSLAGPLLMLAAGAVWGFGIVLQKSVRWNMPISAVAGWQVTISGVMLTISALAFEAPQFPSLATISTAAWATVAFNVFAIAIGAYILWFKIIELYAAQVVSISILLTPVFGVILGNLMLGEAIGWREMTALALIVVAIALVSFEPPAVAEVKA